LLSPAAYSYDAENRLTSTAGVSYTYDGDGQRVMKSTGVLYWYGLGGEVLAEVVGGSWQKEYFYVNGQLLASHDRGPAWVRYYFRDHLGSTRVIARPDGSKCYDADYYPFGGERVYLNTCPDNYKFTGYERDAESDLDYAVHRYYSYRIGRFQTPEPCALTSSACSGATVSLRLFNPAQQSPAETNLYTYVVNNPLNRTDPLGLQWECFPWDPWCWYPCPWWDPFCHERWPRRRPRGEDGGWCPGWPGRACGWAGGGFPAAVCGPGLRSKRMSGPPLCNEPDKFIEEWRCSAGCSIMECRSKAADYAFQHCDSRGRGYYALCSELRGFEAEGTAYYCHCCYNPKFRGLTPL